MFEKKTAEYMVKMFSQEESFEKFWVLYEEFRKTALKNSREYREFLYKLFYIENYQQEWKKAFKLCLNLTSYVNKADSKEIMSEIVRILDKNMGLFLDNDDKKKKFIVLNVCIDILEIMCNDDKIHYPAALYDVLQRNDAGKCGDFYGRSAKAEVIARTYEALEAMRILDQCIRDNKYGESYRVAFAKELEEYRNIRCEPGKQGKKQNKVIFPLLFIVMLACGMYAAFTWLKGDGDSGNGIIQKQESKQEEENREGNDPQEELLGKNSELQNQIKGLEKKIEVLENSNEDLQTENEDLKGRIEELEKKPEQDGQKEPEQDPGEAGNVDGTERSTRSIESATDLYEQPDMVNKIRTLEVGTEVEVLESTTQGGWLRIRAGEDEGYIVDPNKTLAQ